MDEGQSAVEGYTVVTCRAWECQGTWSGRTYEMLRNCVRSSGHGLLVVSGCTLGTLACRSRSTGEVVLLQPCDVDRRPTGHVVMIGPIRTEADRAELQEWIQIGRFNAADLPHRLTALHRSRQGAVRN